MAKHEPFTILPLEYFTFKNSFSGSRGDFNYKIIPQDNFHLLVWYGKNCSAKSKIVAEKDFPLEEESRPQICQWLDQQFAIYDQWRLDQYLSGRQKN